MVSKGVSVENRSPWSSEFAVQEVHAAGSLTIGTFTEKNNPARWIDVVNRRDTLLMHS